MAPPQSRGPTASFSHSRSAPELPPLGSFSITPASTPEERTPKALNGLDTPRRGSSGDDEGDEAEEEDDADFQSHYSLDVQSETGSSDSDPNDESSQPPFRRHSNSSYLSTNAFAPPFYNRPPTPLPPSPSLTSLLRPSFSAATSRPTTPDSSDNDTPNDTEAAVAKSARRATTVPRASPKVPTYEYYGFVLYLLSSLVFGKQFPYIQALTDTASNLGINYYPNRWWSLAIPSFLVMTIIYIYVALATYNIEYLTLPMTSIENIIDEAANIAAVDRGRTTRRMISSEAEQTMDWKSMWSKGTDAVMDVPVGGVCEVLYGE
ncbi:MAG: hypothetical protein Q9214_002699 [Letrouitia sp. 1 TL-2023]